MVQHKCEHCGNVFHWNNAFSKFGYDDGDGDIGTPMIAQALKDEGYTVQYSRWSPHNTLIYSIQKDGIEYMPSSGSQYRIGYDDPKNYLPENIQEILNSKIPPVGIFPYKTQVTEKQTLP